LEDSVKLNLLKELMI
jgi:hypothetical protein